MCVLIRLYVLRYVCTQVSRAAEEARLAGGQEAFKDLAGGQEAALPSALPSSPLHQPPSSRQHQAASSPLEAVRGAKAGAAPPMPKTPLVMNKDAREEQHQPQPPAGTNYQD